LRRNLHGSGALTAPEVVFAICCDSAGRDVAAAGSERVPYPELFLRAGVRFFIGTSMDVVLVRAQPRETLDVLGRLATGFFERWAKRRDGAVNHLFAAKQALKPGPAEPPPLVTALFQIYARLGVQEVAPEAPTRPPAGALVAGLKAGDVLGPFAL